MNEKRNTELFIFIQIILFIISFHFKFKLYSEIFLISFLSFVKFMLFQFLKLIKYSVLIVSSNHQKC